MPVLQEIRQVKYVHKCVEFCFVNHMPTRDDFSAPGIDTSGQETPLVRLKFQSSNSRRKTNNTVGQIDYCPCIGDGICKTMPIMLTSVKK